LAGIPFEDERIKFTDWKELKPKTPYGSLPVLTIDGEMKAQSSAQLRYAASIDPSGSLYPKEKLYEVEECLGLVQDMMDSWAFRLYVGMAPAELGYPSDFAKTDEGKAKVEAMRTEWVEKKLPTFLSNFEAKIEKNGGTFMCGGDKPTIVDCLLVPALRGFTRGHIDFVDTACIKKNSPKLVEYVERFCALPEIKGRYTVGIGS